MEQGITGRMAAANLAIRAAETTAGSVAEQRRVARRGVQAIDDVLDAVETYHLSRRRRRVPMLRLWRQHLEEAGLAIPLHLVRMRNTARLHGALLDWQGELFEVLAPKLPLFPSADEEEAPALAEVAS
jgi:hypothetical protein